MEPDALEEFTPTPITVTGVFPIGPGITSLESAAALYRVYLGSTPWTTDHIAPFRIGPDDYVITPDDGVYATNFPSPPPPSPRPAGSTLRS